MTDPSTCATSPLTGDEAKKEMNDQHNLGNHLSTSGIGIEHPMRYGPKAFVIEGVGLIK